MNALTMFYLSNRMKGEYTPSKKNLFYREVETPSKGPQKSYSIVKIKSRGSISRAVKTKIAVQWKFDICIETVLP